MDDSVVPVVLCGGAGERLWPLSQPGRPKQLLALLDRRTLLTHTLERLAGPPFGRPLAVTGHAHAAAVARHLAVVGGGRLVVEPEGRNTGPAVAAAVAVLSVDDPRTLMLVSPSDHAVSRPGVLREAVRAGTPAARAGHLVVFGLPADHAATGYGWILAGEPLAGAPGCARVDAFEEKPDVARAGELLHAGACWNAGLFLAEAGVLRAELQRHAPRIVAAAERAVERGTWDRDQLHLEALSFAAAPRRSLDHAVVEHTEHAAVVATDPGWSDVGDFGALWAALADGSDHDVVSGEVVAVDTSGCYLRTEGIPLAVAGVHDLVVVATPEGVLVVPRARAQEVRTLVDALRRRSSS